MQCWNMIGAWKAAIALARGPPSAAGTLHPAEKLQQHCPPRGFARIARRAHRNGHRALNLVPIKIARRLAVTDPGVLHGTKLCNLLLLQCLDQAFEIFIEEIVPNRRFEAVTIGRADIGGAFGRLGAWVTDKLEQALSFD